MDRNRRPPFKKRPNAPQFKRGGGFHGGNKRGKFGEQSSEPSHGSETSFRILCQSKKIGSVIGKGGGIVKTLREETQSKITVADTVPGSEERVIMVYSPSLKKAVKSSNSDENQNEGGEKFNFDLQCAAQDALIRVHDKIVEEDIVGIEDEDASDIIVFSRLLVPNNTVGCLLGKKGDVIQRLRNETGASIRILPADQLPPCALNTDELVQISGKPSVVRRALFEVSTLLHQNPKKDKPPSSFTMPIGGPQGFHPGLPMENIPPPQFMRPERGSNRPPAPWMGGGGGGYGNEPPPRFLPESFEGDRLPHGDEGPAEFSMKILCSAVKIGGVIGKGGSNVRQLQQETGTEIHVDEPTTESDERVIRVSAIEALWNPRSRTIDAILFLQDKTSDHNEKGIITTRLLIPSSKVGCILGQGGQVINEMRRRTKADIRVYSKEEKPKCAGDDEELVQVSGSYGVAKEALAEIASRFRARSLRDAKPLPAEPAPVGPSPSGAMRPAGRPVGYDPFKAGGGGGAWGEYEASYPAAPAPPREYDPSRSYPPPPREYDPTRAYHAPVPAAAPAPPREYDPHAYPLPQRASGYPGATGPVVHNTTEATGARQQVQDPYAGVAMEPVSEIQQHMNAASHGVEAYQAYIAQNRAAPAPAPAPASAAAAAAATQVISYHENYGSQQPLYSDSHTLYHTTNTNTNTNTTTGTGTSTNPPAPYPPTTQQGQVQVQGQSQGQGQYPESSYMQYAPPH